MVHSEVVRSTGIGDGIVYAEPEPEPELEPRRGRVDVNPVNSSSDLVFVLCSRVVYRIQLDVR